MPGLPIVSTAEERLSARTLSPELEALAARYDNITTEELRAWRAKHLPTRRPQPQPEPQWKRELREHREEHNA
jgi:hypothetical protein